MLDAFAESVDGLGPGLMLTLLSPEGVEATGKEVHGHARDGLMCGCLWMFCSREEWLRVG